MVHNFHLKTLSIQFSCSVLSDSLWPHGLQHVRPPCPSPTPRVYSNFIESVMPSSHLILCHPILCHPLLPCPQSFPASGSFPKNQFFTSGGQSTGLSASASVLPMNVQDWFPLGWTDWISWLSRVFPSTTIWNTGLDRKQMQKECKSRLLLLSYPWHHITASADEEQNTLWTCNL